QSLAAIAECDLALVLVDARAGVTPADQRILALLRTSGKPFLLVVNKIDGTDEPLASAEFHELGAPELIAVSAAHGRNMGRLERALLAALPQPGVPEEEAEPEADARVRVAVVGRPNVGKSTLVNRILGEERVVVFDQPGTTRDSIYIDFERGDTRYTLIDTAGLRRRRSVHETVEKFSIVKTLQAIADANVVLVLIDAQEGLVEQDVHLLGHVIDSGRALIIACNKWDGLPADRKAALKNELDRRLAFADFAEVHFISALHGSNVGQLYAAIDRAWASAQRKLPTNRLTAILESAVAAHAPPLVRGRRIKLRMAHPGGSNPPLIVIHGNQTEDVPEHYRRYLENVYRRELALVGTPLRIEFVTGTNPFAGRRNTLTPRQEYKRKRLMQHVRKSRR
ncbi:MAG TPA: ribosome biogenesis GTPase Der, partial [Pseudomonadales bacterium]|nr:ribosome biogenesis GTPase Der [Pseudomonadales bacterium]